MNYTTLTVILLTTVLTGVFGQTTLFIEPNISVTYDTTQIKPGDRASNTFYGTELYSFHSVHASDTSMRLTVASDVSFEGPAIGEVDSMIDSMVKKAKGVKTDSLEIVKVERTQFGDFHGFSFWTKTKLKPKRLFITCYLYSYFEGGQCNIMYFNLTPNESFGPADYHYRLLSKLVSGIITYDKSKIEAESQKIRELYSLKIDSLPLRNKYFYQLKGEDMIRSTYDKDSLPGEPPFNHRDHTFRGRIIPTPPLKHQVKEIRINLGFGEEIIDIEGEDLIFTVTDREKGIIKRNGSLVVLSPMGKEVELPFEISYLNK